MASALLSLDAPQNPLVQPGIPPPLDCLRQTELTPGQEGKSGSDPHIINENPHSRLELESNKFTQTA